MLVDGSTNIEITGCHYYNNTAAEWAGGMRVDKSTNIEVSGCHYYKNTAVYGGGMRVYRSTNILISDCHYDSNTARWDAGGMMSAGDVTNITVTSTTGDDNKPDDIYCWTSNFYFDQQSYDNMTNITEGYQCVINVLPEDENEI